MKFKKKTLTITSAVLGAVMMSGAAFANYTNSSGYTECKQALKNLIKEPNYTLKANAKFVVDDTYNVGAMEITQLLDKSGNEKLNLITKETSPDRELTSEVYFQDNMQISGNKYTSFVDESKDYVYNDDFDYYVHDIDSSSIGYMFEINEGDEKMVDKSIRFAELCLDMVVGDLKNNMFLIDSNDEQRTFAIDLESYQIPEIISAGLSLASSDSYYSQFDENEIEEMYQDEPFLKLINDMSVENCNATVVLDNEGRLLSIDGNIKFLGYDYWGNSHTADFTLDLNISDYGTTKPQHFDLTGKKVSKQSDNITQRIDTLNKEIAALEKGEIPENYSFEDSDELDMDININIDELKAELASLENTLNGKTSETEKQSDNDTENIQNED